MGGETPFFAYFVTFIHQGALGLLPRAKRLALSPIALGKTRRMTKTTGTNAQRPISITMKRLPRAVGDSCMLMLMHAHALSSPVRCARLKEWAGMLAEAGSVPRGPSFVEKATHKAMTAGVPLVYK